MNDLTTTIQGIKDAKEDLRGAINAKGGMLAEDAKLSEFKEAVEGLPSGGSAFSVDFGEEIASNNAYSFSSIQEDVLFYNRIQEERKLYSEGKGGRSDDEILQDPEFVAKIAWFPVGMQKQIKKYLNLREYIDDSVNPSGTFNGTPALQLIKLTNSYARTSWNSMLFMTTNLEEFWADISGAESAVSFVQYAGKCAKIYLKGVKVSLSLNSQSELTKDSLVYIFDNCQQADTSYTLTLHKNVIANHEQWLLNDSNYSASYINANAKGLTIA